MNDLINQIQSVGSLSFEDINNMYGWGAIAAGVAVPAGLIAADYFRNPKTSQDALVGDVEVAEQSVEAADNEGRLKSRIKRFGVWTLLGAGISVASVQLLNPTLDYPITVADSEIIHVIDASESMQLTTDIVGDKARFETVGSSLIEASSTFPADLKTGVILFGQDTKLTTPLTIDRVSLQTGIAADQVNSNGGDLDSALSLASDVLASSDNAGNDTIMVYTDGTIENRDAAMATLTEIAQTGTEVLIVMPGTADGSFVRTQFDASPTLSGVNTSGFESVDKQFDNVKVMIADTAAEIQKIIVEQTAKQTQETSKRSTNVFLYLGGAVAALGAFVGIRKDWKRS